MSSGNWLDHLIQRFQHRWETDRQWRAAMGGVLALVVLLGLCGVTFGVSNVAQGVLVGLGIGSSGGSPKDGGTPDTGAKLVNGVYTFPTAVVTWAAGTVPAESPIPNSTTPQPKPTSPPTPTPSPTQPPPSPTACDASCGATPPPTVTIQVTGWNPHKWSDNANVSISVHTSAPNDGYGFIFQFPSGPPVLAPGLQTDGSGNGTYSFQVPAGQCVSGQNVDVKVQVQEGAGMNYGPDANIPCA